MKANDFKLLSLFLLLSIKGYTQLTPEKLAKYETVIYYNNFSYKGQERMTIIGCGQMKDSLKHGKWIYVLPSGKILARGKYKNGYKVGNWEYDFYDYKLIYFKKRSKTKDMVRFPNDAKSEFIDYSEKNNSILLINGNCPPIIHIHFL